ncbi:MAG: GNAT family N-acyltransferase [Rickettsiales bacterium]|nr:GNAT family N-acyltransferase [Rickettsiales bacterium]
MQNRTNLLKMPLNTSVFPDLSDCRIGSLHLKLAETNEELVKSQILRQFVFFEEPKNISTPSGKIDQDEFDKECEHLLVVDDENPSDIKVVGTYRLLRRNETKTPSKFYTEGEFDISKLKNSKYNLLELGRSCIHPKYRDGKAIQLLWRGIGAFIVFHKINYLFGCASFNGIDAKLHEESISYLMHFHKAPDEICPIALPKFRADINVLPLENIDKKKALSNLPSLIKGYIRTGCMIGEGAVIDKICETTDVCTIMDTQKIVKRYSEHFVK